MDYVLPKTINWLLKSNYYVDPRQWELNHYYKMPSYKDISATFNWVLRNHPFAGSSYSIQVDDRYYVVEICKSAKPLDFALIARFADIVTVHCVDLAFDNCFDNTNISQMGFTSLANLAYISLYHSNNIEKQRARNLLTDIINKFICLLKASENRL